MGTQSVIQSVSAGELFDYLNSSFHMVWETCQNSRKRNITSDAIRTEHSDLAGFLNLIHLHKVQLIGPEEISWLDALDARSRWEALIQLQNLDVLAMIVCDGQTLPGDLVESTNETGIPVWSSRESGIELLSHIQHYLTQQLAQVITYHGVFMEVFSVGVIITGASGTGKSELALELISRGHRLVADDAPEFSKIAPDTLAGHCPEVLTDCIEVRGLGILNVRAMFGDSAVITTKYLKLIVHLELMTEEMFLKDAETARLTGSESSVNLLGIDIPMTTLPVAPGRNLAVLVEAAVRNHALKMQGYHSADKFIERQRRIMQDDPESHEAAEPGESDGQ